MLETFLSFIAPPRHKSLGAIDPLDLWISEKYQERKQHDCLPCPYTHSQEMSKLQRELERLQLELAKKRFASAAWITNFQPMPAVRSRFNFGGVR